MGPNTSRIADPFDRYDLSYFTDGWAPGGKINPDQSRADLAHLTAPFLPSPGLPRGGVASSDGVSQARVVMTNPGCRGRGVENTASCGVKRRSEVKNDLAAGLQAGRYDSADTSRLLGSVISR